MEGRQGQVVSVTANLPASADVHARVVERVTTSGPKVEDATILVSGGAGLGQKENFRYIEELAELLGGLPAASRVIVDRGWATSAQQIGLTGKYVAPELYIAVGISGASQHMAGLSRARNIVAINHNAEAPIFRYARYGVVADCLEFMPAFIGKCREALKK
jgi:electron transfer flavoprotein alpha subunit